jgi:DNA-binding SARP family transcriptional activator
MPQQLEIVAHAATALLATWLGLTVLTRARSQRGAREFGLLTACLVAWSVSIVIQRLTARPDLVGPSLKAIEDVTASLLPVSTMLVAVALAVEGRRSRVQSAALIAAFGVSAAVAGGAFFYPDQRLAVTPPHLELPGIPGAFIGWAWIGIRVLMLAGALYWLTRALAQAGADLTRRRQLQATLITLSVGSIGGILRFVPGPADAIPWVGVSLIGLAVVLAAYGVFAEGVFLSAEVGGRAFRYSLIVGLGVTMFVGVLIVLDGWTQQALAVDVPILTAIVVITVLALFDPIADRARRLIRGRSTRESAYDRLLQALGADLLTAQRPEAVIAPALARLSRTFGLFGATVETTSDGLIASHGQPAPRSPISLRLPLRNGDEEIGSVTFGPKRTLMPFTPQEIDLLGMAASFLAASLVLAVQQDVQADQLESLSLERSAVMSRGSVLREAIGRVGADSGLHVFALGPLRVERAGQLVRHWGGAKAGTRHAEALFAFLFDRGERGAGKDEIVELIWPDIELKRADLAFHRTLAGLRTTLEPGRGGGNRGDAVTFRNDRYRLEPSLVEWSDVGSFDEEMAAATSANDPNDALSHLERARSLYRGDYLDDCPFYGDSAQAEERREQLRDRCVDLLLALGERYEERGDRPAAAASFRQARSISGGTFPPADAALTRIGASA